MSAFEATGGDGGRVSGDAGGGGREKSHDDDELAPEHITCIDCGGRCHLLTRFDDENPPMPGDLVTYRCEDCLDRWDLVIPEQ